MKNAEKQEQQSSPNKAVLRISVENCPDMAPIYRKLLHLYRNNPDNCPTLILVEDILEGMLYLKCSDILLLKRGVSLEESMLSDNYFFRDSIPFISFKDLSYDFYTAAIVACDSMKIQCPMFLITDDLHQTRGECWQNRNSLTKLILLKSDLSGTEKMEVMFHELRHAWQHEKDHKKYFKDYRFLDTGINIKEYLMQPAELDAEAFSVYMMVYLGLENYPVKRKTFEDINSEIETRAKRIHFSNLEKRRDNIK